METDAISWDFSQIEQKLFESILDPLGKLSFKERDKTKHKL